MLPSTPALPVPDLSASCNGHFGRDRHPLYLEKDDLGKSSSDNAKNILSIANFFHNYLSKGEKIKSSLQKKRKEKRKRIKCKRKNLKHPEMQIP